MNRELKSLAKAKEVFKDLIDNRFDISSLSVKPHEFVDMLERNKHLKKLLEKHKMATAHLVYFKILSKGLLGSGDYQCMKLIFDKFSNPEDLKSEEEKGTAEQTEAPFYVRIPIVNEDGELTDEFEDIAL